MTLLTAAAAGEAVAVRALLDDIAPTVYGFIYARVGGDQCMAEELLQDTIVEACRSAHTFRGDAALATWMCGIARHRVARYFERERRQDVARAGLTVVPGGLVTTGPDVEVDDRDEVVRALGRLPAVHRQVLVLKYLDGWSVAEIAEAVGRSRVQVQSLLQRARRGLRAELGREP